MPITFLSATQATTATDGSSTLSLSMPSGLASGDMLVAVLALKTPSNQDVNFSGAPAGWTLQGGAADVPSNNNGVRVNVYTRFVNGTEAGSYSWSANGVSGKIAGSILAYRGSDGIPSGKFVTAVMTTSSTNRPTGAITVDANNRLVSIIADNIGSGTQTFYPPDVARVTVQSNNVGFAVGDSNGGVAPGTYTKTGVTTVASDIGVQVIFAIHAAQVANTPPTVSAGSPQTVTQNTTVTLSGSATDADGSVASVQWTQTSGPASTITSPTSQTTTVTGLSTVGSYVYTLTAYDNLGSSAANTVTITVTATGSGGTPPTANVTVSDSIYYLIDASSSVSNPSGNTLTYAISPSALNVGVGMWNASPATTATTYTITITDATANKTTSKQVSVPAATQAGNSTGTTGVETLIFKNGTWS